MSLPDGGRMSTRIFVFPRSPVGNRPRADAKERSRGRRLFVVVRNPNVRLWRTLAGLW
jgi:hypothetical protein